jgi:2-polyprenyl-3-methyl-5-hydroxy-6-metoxy-1,4-benzoquinol methylase
MTPEPAAIAETKLDKVLTGACEDRIKDLPDGHFDVIYFNDVLEHLVDPYKVLEAIKSKLSPNGVIISSIPNVRYFRVLKKLVVNKNWEYEKDGVLDKTHLRFFTSKSIQKMYTDLGYKIQSHQGINKTKSIKPYLYNVPLFFSAMDIFYIQYATVVKANKN